MIFYKNLELTMMVLLYQINSNSVNKFFMVNPNIFPDKVLANIVFMSYQDSEKTYYAVIDSDDLKRVCKYTWSINYRFNSKYLTTPGGILLHRFICRLEKGDGLEAHHLLQGFNYKKSALLPMTPEEHKKRGNKTHSKGIQKITNVQEMIELLSQL